MRGMRRPPHAYVRARCAGGASVVASTGRGCAVFSFSHASAMSNASRVGGGASSAWPCRGPSRGRRGSRSWAGARRARRRRVSMGKFRVGGMILCARCSRQRLVARRPGEIYEHCVSTSSKAARGTQRCRRTKKPEYASHGVL